jgi:hypothetical protein
MNVGSACSDAGRWPTVGQVRHVADDRSTHRNDQSSGVSADLCEGRVQVARSVHRVRVGSVRRVRVLVGSTCWSGPTQQAVPSCTRAERHRLALSETVGISGRIGRGPIQPIEPLTAAAPKSASPMSTAALLRSPRTRWSPCHRGDAGSAGW